MPCRTAPALTGPETARASSFSTCLLPNQQSFPVVTRAYLNNRHVCDGGDVGCRFRRIACSNMSILQGLPTTRCAQIAPSLRVAARTGVCFVALLDPIDIGSSSRALHPSRPG